jgi:hypothetical protein
VFIGAGMDEVGKGGWQGGAWGGGVLNLAIGGH